MTFDVKSKFYADAVRARFTEKVQRAQKKLDVQVVSDSNYYCPQLTHMMERSGVSNTVIGSGRVRWITDYARRQYYGEHFDHSKSDNPNATAKWFESAKARKKDDWEALVENDIKHR